ncbi:MAG: asparaginase [Candidatus Limnocylindria bacterium]
MPATSAHRRVVVFGMGGTIAMTRSGTGGVAPALSAGDLISAVPGLAETGLTIDVVDFRRMPGASLDFADVSSLGEAVDEVLVSGAHGVVVIQGTDTLEETAYLTDLHYTGEQPVVFTGAMRNPTMAGADGPANLLAAVQTAGSEEARGMGVLVVLADEVHAARRVRKTHTASGATFQSPNGGPLGYLAEGRLRVLNRLTDRFAIPRAVSVSPRIALVTITLGDHGELLHGLADRIDGMVVAAMGVGHVPERLVATLEDLASRIPIVLASRTGAGAVATSTYGFPGSESDLIKRGLIPAGFLDPLKSRLLLYAALAAGADNPRIGDAFALAGGYETTANWPWPDRAADNGEQ